MDEEQGPDPHQSEKSEPNPHRSRKGRIRIHIKVEGESSNPAKDAKEINMKFRRFVSTLLSLGTVPLTENKLTRPEFIAVYETLFFN